MQKSWHHFAAILFLVVAGAACADSAYKPSGVAAKEDAYIFGVHPYSNPQDMFEAYEPIMRYLERKVPGTRFKIEASKDYTDFEAKLAAHHFHFALPNPYQTLTSIGHGYRVIAKMTPDEDFRGLLVARADQKVNSPSDLAGKTVCFPSPSAVAGTMLPLLYLQNHGLEVKNDIQIHYVGSQFSSILNAYTGDATACGSTVRFWRVWEKENPDKAKEMRVLWKTDSLPHNGVVARDDIKPNLARQVAAALVGMDRDKELDQHQFTIDQQHFEPANDATYKPMQDFLRHYDQAIGLPAAMKAAKQK